MLGESVLACPRPGLVNCLATPPLSSTTRVSALCADGIRLLERKVVGTDTNFPAPRKLHDNDKDNKIVASAHACAGTNIFVRVVNNYVVVANGHQDNGITCLPRLHYEVCAVAVCEVNRRRIRIVVGGFDGAHTVEFSSTLYSKKVNTNLTESTLELRELPGTAGFFVVAIALTHDAIVVGLLDGRAALWERCDSLPVALLHPIQSAPELSKTVDRITDIALTSSCIVVACWSGVIIVYARTPNTPLRFIVSALPNSSPTNSEHYTFGPTMLMQPSSNLKSRRQHYEVEQPTVIAAVMGNGHLAFIDLTDGTAVVRALQNENFHVSVKGACTLQSEILLWVVDMPRLVSIKWPDLSSFDRTRQLATERRRSLEKHVQDKADKRSKNQPANASPTSNAETEIKRVPDPQIYNSDADVEK